MISDCANISSVVAYVCVCVWNVWTDVKLRGWAFKPVVPARGGAEVALDYIIRLFSSIELARAVRPRTWPQHQANIFFTLHTALFTPCTSRFTLHFTFHSSSYLKSSDFFSPHVTSSDLFSSHPIPSHISSKQVLLNCFHLIRALKKVHLNSSQLFCTPESSYC